METLELIKLAQSGDKFARDKLVEENVGLVWSIVRRYSLRGYESEDLFQIGSIGLIKAIDKFDFNFDVKFSTYAIPLIQGEIKRFLRDDGIIKISRITKENNYKIKKVISEYESKYGCEPTMEIISSLTGLDKEDIVLALETDNQVESIYKEIYESGGQGVCLIDGIKDERNQMEAVVDNIMLKQMLSMLDEEEMKLIDLRYFKGKTQTEIAGIFGMSQVKISRMESKILKRLRKEAFS